MLQCIFFLCLIMSPYDVVSLQLEGIFVVEVPFTMPVTSVLNHSTSFAVTQGTLSLNSGADAQTLAFHTDETAMEEVAQVAVQACDAGTFSIHGSCQACSVCTYLTIYACQPDADTICNNSCPLGSYPLMQGGFHLCSFCAVGKYAASYTDTMCHACAAGSYTATTGQSTCSSCMQGFTSLVGADSCVKVCYYVDVFRHLYPI